MSDPNEGLPLGGGLPPATLASLEAEEQAMKKGKGTMLAVMIGVAVLAVGGFVAMLMMGGENPYGQLGQNINGMRDEHFDSFWGCALRGAQLDEIRNNDDLRAALNTRAEQGRGRYGAHVRDQCLPKLADLGPKLQALMPPEDLTPKVRDLVDATGRLRSGWSAFIAHLDGLAGDAPYVSEDAQEHLTAIERAWFDYRRAHNEANAVIREKLGR